MAEPLKYLDLYHSQARTRCPISCVLSTFSEPASEGLGMTLLLSHPYIVIETAVLTSWQKITVSRFAHINTIKDSDQRSDTVESGVYTYIYTIIRHFMVPNGELQVTTI